MRPNLHPSQRVFSWRQCVRSLLLVLVLLSLLNPPSASAFGLASISISGASVVEGDNGSVNMVFTVTRTGDTTSTVEVGYTTMDGTAEAGADYTPQTGTVTLPSGENQRDDSHPRYRQHPRARGSFLLRPTDRCGQHLWAGHHGCRPADLWHGQ